MSSKYDQKEIESILLNETVDRHSFFQLKYFIIGKEPTHQAKLWRCIRELQSRKDTIDSIVLELEEMEDKKSLMLIDIKKIEKDEDCEEKVIKIRQINRKINAINKAKESMDKKLKFAKEEASFFHYAFKSLEEVEKIKPFDDLESQSEYWERKLRSEVEMRNLIRQPLDIELIKTILSLDKKSQVKKEIEAMCVKQIENNRSNGG